MESENKEERFKHTGYNCYEPLPIGEYVVSICEVLKKTSRDSNDYWSWTLKVVEGDNIGLIVFTNTSTSEKKSKRLWMILTAIGFDPNKDFDIDLSEFKGRKLKICVDGIDEYNGSKREKISKFLPVDEKKQTFPVAHEGSKNEEPVPDNGNKGKKGKKRISSDEL